MDNNFGPLTYQITEGNAMGHFKIDPVSGFITIGAPLDREMIDGYNLTVRAFDDTGQECSSAVIIRVTDTNDNAPIIRDLGLSFEAPCGEANAYIGTVHATDYDLGRNGEVYYFLEPDQFSAGKFYIDSMSGELSTATELQPGVYTIVVMAKDAGYNPLRSSAMLTVDVTCPNDAHIPAYSYAPAHVQPPFPPCHTNPPLTVTLYANAEPGSFVADISGENRGDLPLTYHFLQPERLPFLTMDTMRGVIRTSEPLSEILGDVEINWMATDPFSTACSGQLLLRVMPASENHYAQSVPAQAPPQSPPVLLTFNQQAYVFIAQCGAGNVSVGRVAVQYSGDTGFPVFGLRNNPAGFRIDPRTGELYILAPLPPLPDSYSLTAEAGVFNGAVSVSVPVTIRVLCSLAAPPAAPYPYLPPQCPTYPVQGVTLSQYVPPGTRIAIAQAAAPDDHGLVYGIVGSRDGSDAKDIKEIFVINTQSGDIVLGQSLANTRIPTEVQVRATDVITGLVCFITIQFPVQTAPPACMQGGVNFTISDNQIAGVPFGSVSSYVRGANLRFQIVRSTAGNVVSVDEHSGILALQPSLLALRDQMTGMVPKSLAVTVRAVDELSKAYCDVYVNIFVTLSPPVFANNTYRFPVNCITQGGLIGVVQAVSLTRDLTYDLAGPDAMMFTIGKESGELRSRTVMTAPFQQSFLLNVGVTDAASGMRSQVPAYITVYCTPLVCPPMVTVEVPDDAPVGSILGRVVPMGTPGDPRRLMYRAESPLMLPVLLNSTSGLLSLAEPLPPAASNTNFVVSITDQTGQRCNVTVNLVVLRRPHAPEFVGLPYNFVQSCYPNTPIVGRVTAVSSGATPGFPGANGLIYSISGEDARFFGIDPVSGEIRYMGNAQADNGRYYLLQVTARSRSGLSTSTAVRIEIPMCPLRCPSIITQVVQEDTAQGTAVLRLLDQIFPTERQYFFRIISSSPPDAFQTLSMDPITGALSVNGSLFGRAGQSFQFQTAVTVRNPTVSGNAPSCSIDVHINVAPRRRSVPGCPAPTTVTVRQNAQVGTVIAGINVGDRGDYLYSLTETAGATDFFQIDRATGSITVAKPLQQLPSRTYSLTVRASVRTDVSRFCDTIVMVALQSSNQTIRCPGSATPVTVNVDTTMPPGYPLTAVTAASPTGTPIRFALLDNGINLVDVNRTSGVVVLTNGVFSIPPQTYRFTIRASDYTGAFCDTILLVNVPNMNRPPSFSSSRYELSADCGPPNSLVGVVNARDPEGDQIRFSITPAEFFTIDQLGGIRTRGSIAGESTYPMLTVSAADVTGHITTVPVSVVFRGPQCLVSPRCPQTVYRFTLPAFSSVGYVVGTVSADGGVQPNGQRLPVRFSLFGPDSAVFAVDALTGQVRLANSLVSNSQTAFQIGIRASLVESVNANLFCDITVQIQIPSDSSFPRFSQDAYSIEIPCGNTALSCLGVLSVVPGSGSTKANLAFSAPEDSIIAVDKVTGEVCLRGVLRQPQISQSTVVTVTDAFRGGASATATVTVTFLPCRRPPVCPQQTLTSAVNEGDPVGTRVQQVQAWDLDSGDTVSYSILSGNINSSFEINSESGVITIRRILDREVASSYRLTVSVRDKSSMSCEVVVEVVVIDTNDNAPVFINEPYNWTIPCGQTFPYVGTVSAVDADIGINSRVTYSVAPTIPLQVDGLTGEIHAGRGLNTSISGVHTFVVFAADAGSPQQSASTLIRITVNCPVVSPLICSTSRTLRIPENIPLESTITRILANSDELADRGLRYSLSGSNKFRILSDGRVITAGMFDRENGEVNFFLSIIAVDQVGRECRTNLTIELTDDNDQPPRFTQPSYTFTSTCGFIGPLGQVTATDTDDGLNAAVSYTMGSTSSLVTIDYTSGQLRAVTPLPAQPSFINFTVLASDAGVPPLSATAAVTVWVQCATQVTPTALSMPATLVCPGNVVAEVQENQSGLVISNIVVGNDSGLVYALLPSTDALMFRLDGGNSGRLIVNAPLDREVQSVYFLTVRASNRLSQNCDVPVRVNVVDANDNTPIFAQSIYQFSVDCQPGQQRFFVGRINATDADIGINAMISYTLQNDMYFSIDATSGLISMPAHLPAGSSPARTVVVTASNLGSPVRSSTAMVQIMLNSNCILPLIVTSTMAIPLRMPPPPRCIGVGGPTGYNVLQIPEDIAVGTRLGVFEAVHEDPRRPLAYRLASGDPLNQFSVHSETGLLRTEINLDRECRDNYNLTIMVSDQSGQFCSLAVYIQVLDVNDNAPEVINMLPVVANVGCNEANVDIVRLIAFDRDAGQNAALSFRLDSQPEFSISAAGVLTLVRPLPAAPAVRFVPVLIADGGAPRLTTTITVTINVLCPNDASGVTAPSFEQQYYCAGLRENSPAGTEITRVTARFPASNPNKGYTLKSGNSNWFSVDALTGSIRSIAPMDAEGTVSLSDTTLVVGTLNDNRTAPDAYTTVFINILDENDESPVFDGSASASVTIPASTVPSTAVMRIHAQDHDRTYPNNMVVEYRAPDGGVNPFFRMEPSGELIISSPIDSLRGRTLPLVVLAVDGGTPRRSSSTTVQLSIV